MSGQAWIAVGIIAGAFSTFAIGYGWWKISKDGSNTPTSQIAGDYVAGNKIGGDYTVGVKTTVNQTFEVAGDFVLLGNPRDASSTGALVELVLNVATYIAACDRNDAPTVEGYIDWIQAVGMQSSHTLLNNIVAALSGHNEQASMVRSSIDNVIIAIQQQRDELERIVGHVKLIPDINNKLDYLISELSEKESSTLQEGQLAVSARVLSILTEGLVGSGAQTIMGKSVNAKEGTAMVVWLLGAESPNMMLLDVVGDIDRNRLSIILNRDASITLRAYGNQGNSSELVSGTHAGGQRLVIIATWEGRNLSLWINGKLAASGLMKTGFTYLGPLCLFGLDIDGRLSADTVHWAPSGQEVGLHFMKDGIWHGSRFDTATIWGRILQTDDIRTLTEDPWVMFRTRGE